MASLNLTHVVAILVLLLPIAATADIPGLSPFLDSICNEVECGKGNCEASADYRFNFKCKCDDGWKRTRDLDDERDVEFLPCIIPNCSLDYSCMPAPPPAPPVPVNASFFDPCYWIYCGQGTCAKNKTRTHTCQCDPGHSNLLNISAFPCYSDCAIDSDSCQRLGIRVASSTTSNPSRDDSSQAAASIMGKFNGISILLATAVMIFRR